MAIDTDRDSPNRLKPLVAPAATGGAGDFGLVGMGGHRCARRTQPVLQAASARESGIGAQPDAEKPRPPASAVASRRTALHESWNVLVELVRQPSPGVEITALHSVHDHARREPLQRSGELDRVAEGKSATGGGSNQL